MNPLCAAWPITRREWPASSSQRVDDPCLAAPNVLEGAVSRQNAALSPDISRARHDSHADTSGQSGKLMSSSPCGLGLVFHMAPARLRCHLGGSASGVRSERVSSCVRLAHGIKLSITLIQLFAAVRLHALVSKRARRGPCLHSLHTRF